MMYTFAICEGKKFVCETMENAGPSGQKNTFFILLGFNDNKVLLNFFLHTHILLRKSFPTIYMTRNSSSEN